MLFCSYVHVKPTQNTFFFLCCLVYNAAPKYTTSVLHTYTYIYMKKYKLWKHIFGYSNIWSTSALRCVADLNIYIPIAPLLLSSAMTAISYVSGNNTICNNNINGSISHDTDVRYVELVKDIENA